MNPEQMKARNEAFHLLSIAQRILRDAGLVAYADETQAIVAGMQFDARTLQAQEIAKRTAA